MIGWPIEKNCHEVKIFSFLKTSRKQGLLDQKV